MGFCRDKSLDLPKDPGYNVVRYPSAGIEPLQLIGRQNGAPSSVGPLNNLVTLSLSTVIAVQLLGLLFRTAGHPSIMLGTIGAGWAGRIIDDEEPYSEYTVVPDRGLRLNPES
jgi:hypothetical protein